MGAAWDRLSQEGFFLTPLNAFKQTGWDENRKIKAEGTALSKVMCKTHKK